MPASLLLLLSLLLLSFCFCNKFERFPYMNETLFVSTKNTVYLLHFCFIGLYFLSPVTTWLTVDHNCVPVCHQRSSYWSRLLIHSCLLSLSFLLQSHMPTLHRHGYGHHVRDFLAHANAINMCAGIQDYLLMATDVADSHGLRIAVNPLRW